MKIEWEESYIGNIEIFVGSNIYNTALNNKNEKT